MSPHNSPPQLELLSQTQTALGVTSLELEYGNPELSGPKIINDMKALTRATGVESESSLILKIKELHVALKEIRQEHL